MEDRSDESRAIRFTKELHYADNKILCKRDVSAVIDFAGICS